MGVQLGYHVAVNWALFFCRNENDAFDILQYLDGWGYVGVWGESLFFLVFLISPSVLKIPLLFNIYQVALVMLFVTSSTSTHGRIFLQLLLKK